MIKMSVELIDTERETVATRNRKQKCQQNNNILFNEHRFTEYDIQNRRCDEKILYLKRSFTILKSESS